MKKLKPLAATTALLTSLSTQAFVIDFDDNALGVDDYYGSAYFNATNKQSVVAPWTSGGASFDYTYNYSAPFEWWTDFTYSNQTSSGSGGRANQFRAITGDGVGASQDNYAIGTGFNTAISVDFGGASLIESTYFTNTEYTYYSLLNGGDFGATPFTTGDFFGVTVTGLDAGGNATTSIDVFLAQDENIVDTWVQTDLSALGLVYGLQFQVFSSNSGQPYYFAIDNIQYQTVPVPAAAWLFGSALLGLGWLRKRG